MVKIYLDGGHGGKDSGAVGNGLYEKSKALEMAILLEAYLKTNFENVLVMQSRNDDTYLTLQERTDKANSWNADVFVSLHMNASVNPLGRGFESYIYPNVDSATIALQNIMHEEIMKQIGGFSGVQDRGKKRANFHVLRESKMKAILTENMFISNSADAELMKKDEFLEKIVIGHAIGLERFFGLVRKTRPPTTGELWQVVAGTFSSKENAENHVKNLNADGYSAFVQKKQ